MHCGGSGWMNAQKLRMKSVQNTGNAFKKRRKGATVPRKIATRGGKMNGIPGDVGRRRARQGKGLKKTIFQVEKIILVDSGR